MESKKVRVGVVGVGHFGMHHARIYKKEITEAELVAVVDMNEERARKIGSWLGVPFFTDYREIFDIVDAVSIATPTVTHFEIASDFISRGKHVLIEKPVTATVEEAEKLLEMANRFGVVLQVGHVERFNPAVMALLNMVKNPLYIEARRLMPFPRRNTDVGVVLDLMVHDLDVILKIVNSPVKTIKGSGISVISPPREDVAYVQITFENGVLVELSASRLSPRHVREIHVVEPGRSILVDYCKQTLSIFRNGARQSGSYPVGVIIEEVKVEKSEPLTEELRYFIRCVSEGKNTEVGIDDGKRALELSMKIMDVLEVVPPEIVIPKFKEGLSV